jgi:rhodanese-related sulfurtransferase
MKRIGALVLFAAAVAVFIIGQPSVDQRVAKRSAEFGAKIASRNFHIDPAELLLLMHENQSRLVILDVRDEADYNVFHLHEARRITPDAAGIEAARALPTDAVKVLVDTREARADLAWKRLTAAGTPNVYILAGGIDGWLGLAQGDGRGDGTRAFAAALGARQISAFPEADAFAGRAFTKKVTSVKAIAAPTGGCGG